MCIQNSNFVMNIGVYGSVKCLPHVSQLKSLQVFSPKRIQKKTSDLTFCDVNYFAYGSNVNTTVITGRRNVLPRSTFPCVVHGRSLSFGVPGLPYIEPGFATVVEDACGQVHGVVCSITDDQWQRILVTETGYDVEDVTCALYGGDSVEAKTLVFPTKHLREGLRPSQRYIDLITEGAREWNLANEWQEYLRGLQPYQAFADVNSQVGAALALGSVMPLSISAFLATSLAQQKFPTDLNDILEVSGKSREYIWNLHDLVW
eukprot:CAMPEP_0196593036 /NCGR_PEP_ID=MMETSP1081-20130531/74446_1 /TAXON_ID=36882 /ORGANISM="Pyramimonas amylifera, Strain CCMP720" /LENGTH=259 /DNA_ID=CAMNT_0041916887 /DNA_START=36 /DNA_END=812 /DNA_ORIENTATION=+